MRRLSTLADPEVKEAIVQYRRIKPNGETNAESDFSGEPEYHFARGYFEGLGLGTREAIDAAEFVMANGW